MLFVPISKVLKGKPFITCTTVPTAFLQSLVFRVAPVTANKYFYIFCLLIYIAFFTIVLDSLCKNGWGYISWFLVLLPIIFFFVVLGFFMIYQNQVKNQTIVYIEEDQMI